MRLSKHSKIRMKERAGLKHNEQKSMFKNALLKGKSIADFKEGKTKDFLINNIYRGKVKVYKGYVFIYSKNDHTLYTMYKLPEELGDEK